MRRRERSYLQTGAVQWKCQREYSGKSITRGLSIEWQLWYFRVSSLCYRFIRQQRVLFVLRVWIIEQHSHPSLTKWYGNVWSLWTRFCGKFEKLYVWDFGATCHFTLLECCFLLWLLLSSWGPLLCACLSFVSFRGCCLRMKWRYIRSIRMMFLIFPFLGVLSMEFLLWSSQFCSCRFPCTPESFTHWAYLSCAHSFWLCCVVRKFASISARCSQLHWTIATTNSIFMNCFQRKLAILRSRLLLEWLTRRNPLKSKWEMFGCCVWLNVGDLSEWKGCVGGDLS